MASTIKVSMADLKVAKAPDSLTTLGLGSCIGLTLMIRLQKSVGLYTICCLTVPNLEITQI